MIRIVYTVIYQAFPFAAGIYALCASVAGYPAVRTTVWRIGFALVALFTAVAIVIMRTGLPPSVVPTRDLVASFIGLYGIPMISTLGVASAIELRRLPPWVKLLALIGVAVAGVIAGQYVAGSFFDLVNASG